MQVRSSLYYLHLILLFLRKIIFEKQWMFLDAAIGQLYGSTFDVDPGGHLGLQRPKNTGDDSAGDCTISVLFL